jgi:hypothetical protein
MSFLQLEDGDYLLKEDGDKIVLDFSFGTNSVFNLESMIAVDSVNLVDFVTVDSYNLDSFIAIDSLNLEKFTVNKDN